MKNTKKNKTITIQFSYIITKITFPWLFSTLNGRKTYYIVISLNVLTYDDGDDDADNRDDDDDDKLFFRSGRLTKGI